MKRRRLGPKTIIATVIFSLCMMISTCTVMVFQYKADIMERYSDRALAYAKAAAEFIDGDRVRQYLETGVKDDYYAQVQHFLNVNQANSDLKYYYVYVPGEEDLVYIWDADQKGGSCELGEHENYMVGGKEASFAVFCQNPPEKTLIFQDEVYGYIVSAFYPIFDHMGNPIALVGIDVSMPGITDSIFKFVFHIILNIVIVIGIFSVGLFAVVNHKIIMPIRILNKAARELVSNLEDEKEFEVNIKTNDEIEDLAKSFEHMNLEIKEYIRRLSNVMAEKERISAELNVAAKIQADMLPGIFPPFPERKDIDLYASMKPAKEVGGDFYDFFFIDERYLGIVMADVSGKGVPAALFMVITKTLIKNRAFMGGTPSEILAFVNNQLCENNEEQMFVTVWLGILDLTTGRMVAANAGHEYPVLKRADGDFQLLQDKHGFVLAGMENTCYKDYEICFEPGDMLYVYTDGVTEAVDTENHLFGTERVVAALNQKKDSSCKEVLHCVMEEIQNFSKGTPQFDDITMLCMQYYGEKE